MDRVPRNETTAGGAVHTRTALQLIADGWRELESSETHFRLVKGRRLKLIDRETGIITDLDL